MAKFFGNLHLVLSVGVAAAVMLMLGYHSSVPVTSYSATLWLHVFFGIVWIGLLYYLNFVQVPTMPKIPAEQKGAITGHIAPKVFFFFRYGALLTVVTGLVAAAIGGYGHEALTFQGAGKGGLIGIGMWLGLIMAFNVWFIIWPKQQIALGIVEAAADAKPKAARIAMLTSRINTMLSIPMLYMMVAQQNGGL